MVLPNVPVVNSAALYCNGLTIGDLGSVNNFFVSPGACRDSNNINDLIFNNNITVSTFVRGAGGLDAGIIQPNQMYGVYAIGDSTGYNDPSVCISLAYGGNGLFLPAGYDMFRRIGWVGTNGTPAPGTDFLKWYQFGSGENRTYYYDVPVPLQVAGASTIYAVVPNSTSPFPYSMPPVNNKIILLLSYAAALPANNVQFLPNSSPGVGTGQAGIVRFGTGVASPVLPALPIKQYGVVEVPAILSAPSFVPSFFYRVITGDTVDIASIGFYDNI